MNEIKEKDIKNGEILTEEKNEGEISTEKTEKCEFSPDDVAYIRECMALAAEAEAIDEVPVGAMIVRDGVVLARAFNTRESSKCATHHAEILAIEKACAALGGWRLPGVTLYVSMEPCAMCAGAIINARIPRVVYGARDYRFGAFGSLVDLSKIPFNHIPEVVGGVLAEECSAQLSAYFRKKRDKSSITR